MKSESLTAEQLQDLNRRLQESLQLQVHFCAVVLFRGIGQGRTRTFQGITADILSGVGGSSAMPMRRRATPGRGASGSGSGSGRGGGFRGRGRGAVAVRK